MCMHNVTSHQQTSKPANQQQHQPARGNMAERCRKVAAKRNAKAAKDTLGARTLLGAPGLTTKSKDATRGSWHCY